jgi:hypothetical protein
VFVTTRRRIKRLFGLFLFFLDLDHFTTFVETAVGTDGVRKAHGTAVGAGCEVAGLEGIVRAAVVAAAF